MKGSWIVVLGAAAVFAAGCDDSTDGAGGSGTASTTSTGTSTGTMTTSSTSSTGGNPVMQACTNACMSLSAVSTDMMCAAGTEPCASACPKNFTDFPLCEAELLDYWNCLGDEVPMATCMCDTVAGVSCTGICITEYDAATMCASMM